MSSTPTTGAADVAARQVEQIVAAAQEVADQIREDARRELQEVRERGERDLEEEMNRARKEAILLTQDARRDAEGILAEANAEASRQREQTERGARDRVAAAEKAATEVLEEARALSGGLQQLGRSLGSQADRILRDVSAAHKQMQADLRIGGALERAPDRAPAPRTEPAPEKSSTSPGEPPVVERRPPLRRREAAPLADFEVPSWER
jgi:F0F1-type ATP synthase membrane subunit b/b'